MEYIEMMMARQKVQPLPNHFSQMVKDLVYVLLLTDPELRPSAKAVVECDRVKEKVDYILCHLFMKCFTRCTFTLHM